MANYVLSILVEAKDKASDVLGGIKGAALGLGGATLTGALGLGAALTGIGVASVGMASDTRQAVSNLQAELGLTADAAQALGDVAVNVWKNNFGSNVQEAATAVGQVRQQLGDLGGNAGLQAATEKALALKDVFGIEVGQSVDAAKTLMTNFGLSSEQAFDFVAAGMQKGLNRSGDFLDSIGEYATQFANGGASAEGFFSLLQSGLQGGVLGTDKAADAFKEFRVRIQDGSKATAEGLSALGINAAQLGQQMASGQVTAAQAFQLVLDRLRSTDNASIQMQAGVALLGTQFEDLGQSGALALSLTGTKMSELSGATDSLNAKYANWSSFAAGASRQVTAALLPLGSTLLDIANSALPTLTAGVSGFAGMVSSGVQTALPALQLFGAAFNFDYSSIDSLSASLSGIVGTGATEAIVAIGMAFGELPQTASGALNLVQGIVTGNLDQIKSGLSSLDDTSVFDFLGENAEAALDSLSQSLLPLSGYFQTIGSSAAQVGSIISGSLGTAFQTAGQIASVVLAGLPGLFLALAGPAQTIAGLVGSLWVAAFSSAGSIMQSVLGILPGLVSIGMSVLTSMAGLVGSVLAGAYQTLAPIAISVFQGIASVVQMVMPAVLGLASAVGSFLATAFQVLQVIALSVFSAIQPYIPALQNAISTVAGVVGSVLAGAFNFVSGVIQSVVIPAFILAGAWLANNLPIAIQVVAGFFQNVLWPAVQNVAGWFVGTLIPLLGELATWLGSTVTGALAVLSEFWQTHGDQIVSIAQTAWDTIRGAVDVALGVVSQLMSAFTSAREGDWRGFGEKLRELWDAAWDGIKSAVTRIGPQIVSAVGSVISDAKTKFTEIDWPGIGQSIIDGVARGISGAASVVADAARRAASAALDAARGFLGIASPSAVMADQVGAPMAQGLAAGFLSAMQGQGTQAIVASLSGLVGGLASVARELIDSSNMFGEGLGNETERLADLSAGIGDVEKIVNSTLGLWDKLRGLQKVGGLGDTTPLTGLGVQLSSWAANLVSELSEARRSFGEGVVEALRSTGEAVGIATTLATNSLGLFKVLTDVLAFDFGSLNFEAARAALKELAVKAVFVVGGAASAALAVGGIDTSGLAPLRTATEALVGQAQATLSLIALATEALRFDFAAINFGRARDTLRDLATIALFFLRDAANVALGVKEIDVSGLAPLRAASDELRAVGEATMSTIRFAANALRFDFASVDFGRARDLLRDFVVIAVFFLRQAAHAALAIRDINFSGLSPLRAASDELRTIGETTMASIRFAVEALKFDFASVNFGQLRDLFRDLVTITVFLVRDAATSALAIKEIDVSGLSLVRSASEALRGAAEATFNTIKFALDAMKTDLKPVNLESIKTFLVGMLQQGMALAATANATLGPWTIEVKPALENVGRILGQSNTVLGAVLSIAEALESGALVQRLTTGSLAPLIQTFSRLIEAGKQLAVAANDVVGSWSVEVKPALENMGKILASALSGLKNTFDIVDALEGRGDFAGISTGDLRVSQTTPSDYTPLQLRIMSLLHVGKLIAIAATAAMAGWSIDVKPALEGLTKVLSSALGGLKNTFDILDAIEGKGDFAGLPLSDLQVTAAQPSFTPLQMRIMGLLHVGKLIAVAAVAAMAGWSIEVSPVLVSLGQVLSMTLGIAKDTLDLSGLLSGDKFPSIDLTLILTRLVLVLGAGKEMARVANETIGTWTLEVAAGLVVLGRVLADTLKAAGDTLNLNALLSGDKFPFLDLGLILGRLRSTLEAGKALAAEANTTIGVWTLEVAPGLLVLGRILGDVLGIAGDALDLGSLLSPEKFPVFDLALLKTRLVSLLTSGKELASTANAVMGTWTLEVAPGFGVLGTVLGDSLGSAKDVLDLNSLLSADKFPSFDTTLLVTRLALVLVLGKALTDEAQRVIGAWTIEALPALGEMGKIVGDGLSLIKDVLDLSKLAPTLASFTGLNMAVLGPKIDLLIANAIAIADQFGRKAKDANIPAAFATAGEQVAKLFGDAFGVLTDSLDLGKLLLDRENIVPSLSQIQPKLDALWSLVEGVVTQFAAKASDLATRGVNIEGASELGSGLKEIFGGLREVASAIQDFTGIAISASGFNNIQKALNDVFGLFEGVAGRVVNVNAAVTALSSILGGLTNLAGASGFEAGESWGTGFLRGMTGSLVGATGAAGEALGGLTRGQDIGGGTITNSTVTITNNNTYNMAIHVDTINAESVSMNFGMMEALAA